MHGRTDAKPDDMVQLHINASKSHIFEAQTGKRLD
jgi:hypothetical protein